MITPNRPTPQQVAPTTLRAPFASATPSPSLGGSIDGFASSTPENALGLQGYTNALVAGLEKPSVLSAVKHRERMRIIANMPGA